MGNHIFSITKCSPKDIPIAFNPSNYEWLSLYSLESGLSIVEVERLWLRFQQLGCDSNGLWTLQSTLKSSNKIRKNAFHQNIIDHLRAPGQQTVSFYDFINAALWLERSSNEDKLKASFAIINKNHPITIDSFTEFLISMFPWKALDEIYLLVGALFGIHGIENSQTKVMEIGEDDFIFFLKSKVSKERLQELFQFKILPSMKPVDREVDLPIKADLNMDSFSDNINVPTDVQLEEIALLIGDKDHTKLAGLLGILQYDLAHLENINRGNKLKIVFSILREWKLKEGARALFSVLKRALYSAGFIDIVNKIEFGA